MVGAAASAVTNVRGAFVSSCGAAARCRLALSARAVLTHMEFAIAYHPPRQWLDCMCHAPEAAVSAIKVTLLGTALALGKEHDSPTRTVALRGACSRINWSALPRTASAGALVRHAAGTRRRSALRTSAPSCEPHSGRGRKWHS